MRCDNPFERSQVNAWRRSHGHTLTRRVFVKRIQTHLWKGKECWKRIQNYNEEYESKETRARKSIHARKAKRIKEYWIIEPYIASKVFDLHVNGEESEWIQRRVLIENGDISQ